MGNATAFDTAERDQVSTLKTDSGASRPANLNHRDVEDGASTLPEVTTQTASFGRRIKKQVSFDELSIRSARNISSEEELILATQQNQLHPKVVELSKKYLAPFEISLPAIEGVQQVFQFKKTGSTYQGEVYDGKPHGRGTIITTKGALIQGLFEYGLMKGMSRIIDPSGTVYIGHIENRLKNGKGFYRESGGCTIDAMWQNGVTNGFVIVKGPSGGTIFEGTTVAGRRHGFGKLHNHLQKYSYEGEFQKDLFDGQGKKVFENGKVYIGAFRSGIEHGYGELHTIDGRIIKAIFDQGVPKGQGILVTNEHEEKEAIF